MADEKLKPTSFDTILASLSPALIIAMIGSLVSFLMTALYQGEYPARLMWVLGLFTLASVLITRIAIEQSRAQSMVYLGLLGAATLFVAPRYFVIEGPLSALSIPILIGFLILIAYLADRITMDCTSIDHAIDSHGEGLLQSLGLLKRSQQSGPSNRNLTSPSRLPTRAASGRKHNPGVWVLYFSLLALPVFGLGQLMIASPSGRRLALGCMLVYLLSALSLLVVISLLALRQYVRQRDVEMEGSIAARWLIAGFAAVAVLIGLMALLPLPLLNSNVWEPPFRITSQKNLQPSRWGWGNEGAGEAQQPQNAIDAKQPPDGHPNQPANNPQGKPDPQGKSDPQSKPDQQSKSDQQNKPDQQSKSDQQNKSDQQRRPEPDVPQQQQQQPGPPPPPSWSMEWNLGAAFRWLVLLVLFLIVAYCGVRYRNEMMSAIRDGIASLLAWFRRPGIDSALEDTSDATANPEPTKTFASLSNPFVVHRNDPDALVRALFDSVAIWGKEHRVERREDETPEEYLRRLGRKYSDIADPMMQLGMIYSRLAYAKRQVRPEEAKALSPVWEWMNSHVARSARPAAIL